MDATTKLAMIERVVSEAPSGPGLPAEIAAWRERALVALRVGLGEGHPTVEQFRQINFGPLALPNPLTYLATGGGQQGTTEARALLDGAHFEVLYTALPADSEALPPPPEDGRIFVVHGHGGREDDVASEIARLTGTPAVILREQANASRTIIEKFEDHASMASFAIVILTNDDIGRSKSSDDDLPRARQNVVFEAGYFIGRLGRPRVVLLYEPGVELPSDLQGVLWTELDDDRRWVGDLHRELKNAQIPLTTDPP